MTEHEWLAGRIPRFMLDSLVEYNSPGDRKLRLYACACARLTDAYASDFRLRRAVEVAERFSDTGWDREQAIAALEGWHYDRPDGDGYTLSWRLVSGLAIDAARQALDYMVIPELVSRQTQADLLRHIVGNPFNEWYIRDHERLLFLEKTRKTQKGDRGKNGQFLPADLIERIYAPVTWLTPTITDLAEAIYNGNDCAFALHDALIDAGSHEALSSHFKDAYHPRGCWVVDLLLRRSPVDCFIDRNSQKGK